VHLTLTKSSWLPSMKYRECVTKITETVISPEVQLHSFFFFSISHQQLCNG